MVTLGLAKLKEEIFAKEVDGIIQSSPNPILAKLILYRMQFDSPGCKSNNGLSESIGAPQEEINKVLPYLEENQLVRLERRSDRIFTDWKWDVWRQDEVKPYLQSEIPFGPYDIIKKENMTNEQLLKAMESVADSVKFRYEKHLAPDIEKLRKIRDETHKEIESLREKEIERIYSQLELNKNWRGGLPYFIQGHDSTRSEGYDVSRFNLYGSFPTPAEAFNEDFDSASADVPLDNEGNVWRVHMINVYRRGDNANRLTLQNSRYSAASTRSIKYLNQLDIILPEIQSKLEEALSS